MYENILLESGKIFRGSRVSGVGGKVVDDSQTITILVATGYGTATIVEVTNPYVFMPGVAFPIMVQIKNTGNFDDVLFIRITNTDTGAIEGEANISVPAGQVAPPFTFLTTLIQTTDFHGLIEAGHDE
jgi:hypothetical protein